ncbi:glycosyltransferase family protein [Megalodesulfovibrio gigas]|uniref:Uncharacterized protein n=1 Tax=Megalodesulfovibrio gigas (strain ATCC 19364 / DSM 1382 / NCIMB 9332 / VKM B-1759) TaxID=1121448 RepID=T2GGA3_MEGG1|nr:glycosyltransferase [Megalodesulfovibrio gigas]AGW15269.1 hypothetical protein DGI_4057 [Megalodesulfovibrio gigas DSM 1382 = ATCC 19364]
MAVTAAYTRAVVVEKQANPSTEYFVLPALKAMGCRVERRGFDDLPPADSLAGALVVLVRYAPSGWVELLSRVRPQLGGLVFFMDDDVLDVSASRGVRLKYRWRLWKLAARRKGWLQRHRAGLWVSTPYLQQKYAAWNPTLTLPAALPPEVDDTTALRRIFYHGTASHAAEIRWLQGVILPLLDREPRLHFEITGSGEVVRRYARHPRVAVIHPMPWPAYLGFTALAGRHVGLAPQLPSAFNAARSHTKFFDITRSGAVGVYAADSACAAVVEHGQDGLLVPMDPAAWAEAIATLAFDDAGRARMLAHAQRKAEALSHG